MFNLLCIFLKFEQIRQVSLLFPGTQFQNFQTSKAENIHLSAPCLYSNPGKELKLFGPQSWITLYICHCGFCWQCLAVSVLCIMIQQIIRVMNMYLLPLSQIQCIVISYLIQSGGKSTIVHKTLRFKGKGCHLCV